MDSTTAFCLAAMQVDEHGNIQSDESEYTEDDGEYVTDDDEGEYLDEEDEDGLIEESAFASSAKHAQSASRTPVSSA